MKKYLFRILALFLVLSAISCQVTKKTSEHTQVDTSIQKTDSISQTTSRTSVSEVKSIEYISVADSASITALMECDSLGRVHIKEITELRAGLQVKPKFRIKNNYIEIECKVDSFQVYQIIKNRYDTVSGFTTKKSDTSEEIKTRSETDKKTDIKIGPSFSDFIIPGILLLFLIVLIRWAKKKGMF